MVTIATEFPVRPNISRAEFIAQVAAWLKGMKGSTIFENPDQESLGGDSTNLMSASGEELRVRELDDAGRLIAIGFRHDFPDQEGRIWRTETTLRWISDETHRALLRVRTQCVAKEQGAQLTIPKKPYLIKRFIQDNWTAKDGVWQVTDEPHWLNEHKDGLELANKIILGDSSFHLPVIYVSAVSDKQWSFSQDQIKKMAFDLGGLAHVIVEPSRSFSFALRDLCQGKNVYGGTIGVIMPGRGVIRRMHIGWRLSTALDLLSSVRDEIIIIRTQMPSIGWDWTELQEQAIRFRIRRDSDKLNKMEIEDLFNSEIENLQDHIKQLENDINQSRKLEKTINEGIIATDFISKIGFELYNGEILDRIRFAVCDCLSRAEQIGLDDRSKYLFNQIREKLAVSENLIELREELKRATRDQGEVAKKLVKVLVRLGFTEKSDNKHIRLDVSKNLPGVTSLTISKTPSEYRASENLRKQIEKSLGITKLK